ncbi:MAG: methyl-accepting chemotaxis protein, partial [Thermoplasmata archaeon]
MSEEERSAVRNINSLIDKLAKPPAEISVALEKLSHGEIPSKISTNFGGEYEKIKLSLNRCIDAIDRMRLAVRQQCISTFEGNLNNFVELSGHEGVYLKIVKGMNDIFTTISEPLKIVIDHLHFISNGIPPSPITKEYKGDYKKLIDALNELIASFNLIINNITEITHKAQAGDLSARADPSKYSGVFREVLTGINAVLDAFTHPMEEAIRLAKVYAEGKLEEVMEVEVQGDFIRFKEALESIGRNLSNLLSQVTQSIQVMNNTSQDLASSAEEMNASTEQVSSAIQQISKGAVAQAQQIEETGRIMHEMAINVEEVSNSISILAKTASDNSGNSKKGKDYVQEVVGKMRNIQRTSLETASAISTLGKKSEEISQIITFISNITDQTNMLALNAAIEAARAGEHGRGFAVVADEVKNLAEDSREAAERIARMIKEIQDEINRAVSTMKMNSDEIDKGVRTAEETETVFARIEAGASTIVNGVEQILASTQKLKEGTERVATAIDNVASIAEETASSAEESASSTEELTAAMEELTAKAQELSHLAAGLHQTAEVLSHKENNSNNMAAYPFDDADEGFSEEGIEFDGDPEQHIRSVTKIEADGFEDNNKKKYSQVKADVKPQVRISAGKETIKHGDTGKRGMHKN